MFMPQIELRHLWCLKSLSKIKRMLNVKQQFLLRKPIREFVDLFLRDGSEIYEGYSKTIPLNQGMSKWSWNTTDMMYLFFKFSLSF